MNPRTQRAQQMMEKPNCAVQFSPEKFSVRSQSIPQLHYIVSKTENGLICDCPDHIKRKSDCKHIKIVLELIKKNQGNIQVDYTLVGEVRLAACMYVGCNHKWTETNSNGSETIDHDHWQTGTNMEHALRGYNMKFKGSACETYTGTQTVISRWESNSI